MPSFLVTGASRGLGFEFIRQLSEDPTNIVVGFVRNKVETEKKIAGWNRSNVHLFKCDVEDYNLLKEAVAETSKITGGSLDYLIANAGFISDYSRYTPIGDLGKEPAKLEEDLLRSFNVNVVGNVHLFNLSMPLIKKGSAKKVITISSAMAEIELINRFDVDLSAPYAISKAAMNAAVAKFSAQYKKEGILFISISPGFVDTGHMTNMSDEQMKGRQAMAAKFAAYAPHFKGPATPEESVRDVMKVIRESSVEGGSGGAFVSHFGNKQWL